MVKLIGLNQEHAEVFAKGLFHLATIDGLEKREEQLIREFLIESEVRNIRFEDLGSEEFNPIEAMQILETSFLRRLFLKTAIALVKTDGRYTNSERQAIGHIADVFGISNAEFGELEQELFDLRVE